MSTVINHIEDLDPINGLYTYADYLLWKFKERVEIIKGKLFKMSAPAIEHQEISFRLSGLFFIHFRHHTCKVFTAPFDVVFKGLNGKEDTVVQPDLCVVCDPEKLSDGKRCQGAPDLIVEILSPSTAKKDLNNKFRLYEEAGVSEYWIVRPEEQSVTLYVLENGNYRGLIPITEGDTVQSVKFPTLRVHTKDIFS